MLVRSGFFYGGRRKGPHVRAVTGPLRTMRPRWAGWTTRPTWAIESRMLRLCRPFEYTAGHMELDQLLGHQGQRMVDFDRLVASNTGTRLPGLAW
jgi:hypothetical protein